MFSYKIKKIQNRYRNDNSVFDGSGGGCGCGCGCGYDSSSGGCVNYDEHKEVERTQGALAEAVSLTAFHCRPEITSLSTRQLSALRKLAN